MSLVLSKRSYEEATKNLAALEEPERMHYFRSMKNIAQDLFPGKLEAMRPAALLAGHGLEARRHRHPAIPAPTLSLTPRAPLYSRRQSACSSQRCARRS